MGLAGDLVEVRATICPSGIAHRATRSPSRRAVLVRARIPPGSGEAGRNPRQRRPSSAQRVSAGWLRYGGQSANKHSIVLINPQCPGARIRDGMNCAKYLVDAFGRT